MKALLAAVLAMSSLSACSGSREDSSTPAPASVTFDSSGVVVDTTAADTTADTTTQ